jgi:NAD(P)H dehydrogenase (quinone)
MLASPRDGRIKVPFGTAPIAAVVRADLADAAFKVLSNPEAHGGFRYELSGVAPFSVPELAQRLDVDYEPSSLEYERKRLSKLPLLPFQAPMLLSISSTAIAGFLNCGVSDLKKLVPKPRDALSVASDAARQHSS